MSFLLQTFSKDLSSTIVTRQNCPKKLRDMSFSYIASGNKTWKSESFYSLLRHLRRSLGIHVENRALQSYGGGAKFFVPHFRCVPQCAFAKTNNILSDCSRCPAEKHNFRPTENSRIRFPQNVRPLQWRNNDFTPPLTKLYRWSLREVSTSERVFLNFLFSAQLIQYRPAIVLRAVFYSAYLDTFAKSVTFFLITFLTSSCWIA